MKRIALLALAALVAGVFSLAPTLSAAAQSQITNQFKGIPVTGRITEGQGGTFDGTLDIERFQARGDQQLVAHGKLSGILKLANGETKEVKNRAVSWPVQSINDKPLPQAGGGNNRDDDDQDKDEDEQSDSGGSLAFMKTTDIRAQQAVCNVLSLVLGPLDLNLLGLRVQLNQLNLLITAIPGGGLLGDLLCGIANLLNLGFIAGILGQIADLLNQIIAALP